MNSPGPVSRRSAPPPPPSSAPAYRWAYPSRAESPRNSPRAASGGNAAGPLIQPPGCPVEQPVRRPCARRTARTPRRWRGRRGGPRARAAGQPVHARRSARRRRRTRRRGRADRRGRGARVRGRAAAPELGQPRDAEPHLWVGAACERVAVRLVDVRVRVAVVRDAVQRHRALVDLLEREVRAVVAQPEAVVPVELLLRQEVGRAARAPAADAASGACARGRPARAAARRVGARRVHVAALHERDDAPVREILASSSGGAPGAGASRPAAVAVEHVERAVERHEHAVGVGGHA